MKKSKYIIYADAVRYGSNSRNARKHLKDSGCDAVTVCKNDDAETILSCAFYWANCIMVGTYNPNLRRG